MASAGMGTLMRAAKWAKLKRGSEAFRGNQYTGGNPPIGGLPQSETKTRDEAAKLLSVGTSSIDRARPPQESRRFRQRITPEPLPAFFLEPEQIHGAMVAVLWQHLLKTVRVFHPLSH
jgi:hypothetical protein